MAPHLGAEVPRDGVKPRRERRGFPNVLGAPHRREQGLLRDVLGVVPVVAHLHREAKHRRRMALKQLAKRRIIACLHALQQFLISRHRTPSCTVQARCDRRS